MISMIHEQSILFNKKFMLSTRLWLTSSAVHRIPWTFPGGLLDEYTADA